MICLRDGYLCLVFRVGDMREKSHLINATIRLYLIQSKHTQEGEILTPYLQELSVSKLQKCFSILFSLCDIHIIIF